MNEARRFSGVPKEQVREEIQAMGEVALQLAQQTATQPPGKQVEMWRDVISIRRDQIALVRDVFIAPMRRNKI